MTGAALVLPVLMIRFPVVVYGWVLELRNYNVVTPHKLRYSINSMIQDRRAHFCSETHI